MAQLPDSAKGDKPLTIGAMNVDPAEALRIRRHRAEGLGRETRNYSAQGIELREEGDSYLFTGHATVFEVEYEVYGGPPFGWIESVELGACDKTLRESADVSFLVNHEGMTLARTKSGTLRLSVDNIGLRSEADLEPGDPDVQALVPKMRRRDMDEMSLAMRVTRQEWNDDYTRRKILELDLNRGDVSIVNYGANSATSAQLRAADIFSALATLDQDELLVEARSMASVDVIRRAHEVLSQILMPASDPAPPSFVKRQLVARELELLTDLARKSTHAGAPRRDHLGSAA